LTARQIKSYFRKVSPLDKAGSFDIQGLGGLFIDRIEGCYYNVAGLPLAKLAKMLSRVGVDLFDG
jgi:septum formation protein